MPDNKLKLLIAVESVMTRGSIKKLLSSSNLAMFFTSADDDTLITMRDKQPHVVIIDWDLPQKGASYVLKEALDESLNAAFIIIDPKQEAANFDSPIYQNVRKYITLPIQKSELKNEILNIAQEILNKK